MREVPEHFQLATELLNSIQEVKILDVWKWYEERSSWALRFQIDIDSSESPLVPSITEWYILVTDRYPVGRIRVFPAREHGLSGTFHHQRYNRAVENLPWTLGEICVDVPGYLLDRLVPTAEPTSVSERLYWHVDRAKEWVKAAAGGDLVRDNERFELPDFYTTSPDTRRFAFSEGTDSIAKWVTVQRKAGLVRLSSGTQEKLQQVVPLAFLDLHERTLVDVQWGHFFQTTNTIFGGWVLLPKVPVISPWQAPVTWGELFDTAASMNFNLLGILTKVFARLRDGQEHLLLIGFPMPELIGSPPFRIHWQALSLPRLSTLQDAKHGFRPTSKGAMRRDLGTILSNSKNLKWIDSNNWDSHSWGSRGNLNVASGLHVVIIGLGAIGSSVTEMLVRGGINDIVLIDGDEIDAGNLVRHTLTLSEEGMNKASAIASRLNSASPHARVEHIASYLDPRDPQCRKAIEQADLVIDCTADDEVLTEIHEFSWRKTAILVSLSIGLNGERIYVYSALGWSFSVEEFKQVLNPLIQQDYEAHPDFILPQEYIGCWHPIFPARSDDIWFLSSLAVKEIEDLLRTKSNHAELRLIKYDGQIHREVLSRNAS